MDINNWGFNNAVVVIGLVVVFVILILLVILCTVMGKIFQSLNNTKKDNSNNTPVTSVKPQGNTATINMVQDGIGDDVVAAITAAIAVIMSSEGNTKPFTVRSIRRVKESRPAWNVAGISENTRPF